MLPAAIYPIGRSPEPYYNDAAGGKRVGPYRFLIGKLHLVKNAIGFDWEENDTLPGSKALIFIAALKPDRAR
jgi:hypothetical protein